MTIASSVSKVSYVGNESTTTFPIPFAFTRDQDLEVVLRAAGGAESILTLTTDYTLTGAGDPAGGSCTLTAAPTGESSQGAGDAQVLAIRRVPQIVQETDYQENDPFPAQSHEAALDTLTMICQSLDERLSRAVLMPLTSSDAPPTPVELIQASSDAQTARDQAQEAQIGAETARDQAAAVSGLPIVATGDAGKAVTVNATEDGFTLSSGISEVYKAPTPIVSGATTVHEGAAIVLTIADHQAGDFYELTANPMGLTLSNSSITGTAPDVGVDTSYTLRFRRVRPDAGLLYSDECAATILVQHLPLDPEGVAWANDATDWPTRANVDVGTGQLEPAFAVMEVLGVDGTSSTGSLVLTHAESGKLAAGDILLLGDDEVFECPAVTQADESTPASGDSGCTPDAAGDAGYTYIAKACKIPNGVSVATLLGRGSTTGHLGIFRDDGNGLVTCVAITSEITFTATLDSFALSYTVPATGDHYVGVVYTASAGSDFSSSSDGAGLYEFSGVGTVNTQYSATGGTGTSNVDVGWTGTTPLYSYTMSCSPALSNVPEAVHKLPELKLASATESGTITAPEDFSASPIASVSRNGSEYTVTCVAQSLPVNTRKLAVGIEGDGWSAYSATDTQNAEQSNWTQTTVSMILGADFFKTATASTLMEE